jgi:flagellar biosynthesis protein FliQ
MTPVLTARRNATKVNGRITRKSQPMSYTLVVDLARNAIMTALMLAGPLLLVALGTGLLISVVQAVTQIQEQTLSFVPKLFAVAGVFLLALPWMLQVIVRYTLELFRSFPLLIS